MKTTIKKRIEEINSGIVPEGYEKTSFGIFPCDWKITRIKSIAYLNKQKFNPQENKDNLVCIELEHIVPERGVLNGNTYAQNKHSLKNTFCKGDILFGKLRPYLGKYYHADQKGVCSTEIWVIRNNNTIDNNFLFQLVKGKRFIQSAQDSAFGTKMPRAEWQKVEKEKFVIPTSFREQSRIAEVLMQWDKAIELQEKLIEAYQKSKKYYLKKMFPKKGSNIPEIRFPGFTAPWEQRKFAEVYSFASEGGTPDTNIAAYYRNGTIPFVRIEDTENKYIDSVKTFITEEGLKHSSAWLIPSDSVIFTNGATVGNVAINRIPVATKQGILGIIPNKTVTTEYLYYLLSAEFFQREVRNRQATGTFATIILKNLNEINVFVPDKSEQQKISGYLSSIDNLITLHQQKRDKLVAQRKAMQQYLLTGIVRV